MKKYLKRRPVRCRKADGRGGSVFPRIALKEAIDYARKLVSKTHTSAQPEDVILSGVFGSKTARGKIRLSALKQYGLLKGDTKSNYSADDLAKKIASAPPEELVLLYRQAMLKPTIFKKLFDTFHGDLVSKAKLKQRAADLKVHPDETASCVDIYVAGMLTAGLVSVESDQIKHLASNDIGSVNATPKVVEADPEVGDELGGEVPAEVEGSGDGKEDFAMDEEGANEKVVGARGLKVPAEFRPQAVFNVNVTLDSSLDIEKLQKQLELLKRFGAI